MRAQIVFTQWHTIQVRTPRGGTHASCQHATTQPCGGLQTDVVNMPPHATHPYMDAHTHHQKTRRGRGQALLALLSARTATKVTAHLTHTHARGCWDAHAAGVQLAQPLLPYTRSQVMYCCCVGDATTDWLLGKERPGPQARKQLLALLLLLLLLLSTAPLQPVLLLRLLRLLRLRLARWHTTTHKRALNSWAGASCRCCCSALPCQEPLWWPCTGALRGAFPAAHHDGAPVPLLGRCAPEQPGRS